MHIDRHGLDHEAPSHQWELPWHPRCRRLKSNRWVEAGPNDVDQAVFSLTGGSHTQTGSLRPRASRTAAASSSLRPTSSWISRASGVTSLMETVHLSA